MSIEKFDLEKNYLKIICDKQCYYSGRTVKGSILINSIQNYPCSTISLQLIGTENVKYRELKVGNFKESSLKIYDYSTQIAQLENNTLAKGQYIYPFEFQLENNIPGTYEFNSSEFQCKINYIIVIDLQPLSSQIQGFLKTYEMIIRQDFKNSTPNKLQKQCTCIPKNMFCQKQGIFELRCLLEKTHYYSNESIKLHSELDASLCQIGVTQIVCQVVNRIKAQTADGKKIFSRKKIIIENSFYGIGARTALIENQHKIFEIPLNQNKKKNLLLSSLISNQNYINTQSLFKNSIEGQIVKNRYYLDIEIVFGSCGIYTSNNKIIMPLSIECSDINSIPNESESIQVLPNLGENWKPQVMSLNQIKLQFYDNYSKFQSKIEFRKDNSTENKKVDKDISQEIIIDLNQPLTK